MTHPPHIEPLTPDARLARELVNIAMTDRRAYEWSIPELRRQLKMDEEAALRMGAVVDQMEGRERLVAIWGAGVYANRALHYEAVLRERTAKAHRRRAAA